MATILIGLSVIAIIGLAAASVIRSKKASADGCGCSGSCAGCGGACHMQEPSSHES